jgi:hypothetical protein
VTLSWRPTPRHRKRSADSGAADEDREALGSVVMAAIDGLGRP